MRVCLYLSLLRIGAPRVAVLPTARWLNAHVAGSLGGAWAAPGASLLSSSSSSTSVLLPESRITRGGSVSSAWPVTATCGCPLASPWITSMGSTSMDSICTARIQGKIRLMKIQVIINYAERRVCEYSSWFNITKDKEEQRSSRCTCCFYYYFSFKNRMLSHCCWKCITP